MAGTTVLELAEMVNLLIKIINEKVRENSPVNKTLEENRSCLKKKIGFKDLEKKHKTVAAKGIAERKINWIVPFRRKVCLLRALQDRIS